MHRLAVGAAVAVTSLFVAIAGDAFASDPKAARPAAHPSSKAAPSAAASASAAPADEGPDSDSESDDSDSAVQLHWQGGPRSLDLGHDVSLALPERDAFLGMPEAGQLLEKFGNFHNENLLGVVVSKEQQASWVVTIRYEDEGYVKDTEAIDADELLNDLKEGTEEANKERAEHGFNKALHVTGWSEPPRYEKTVHHLVWALRANSDDGETVNFNTRVLGRRGIVSLNLICDPEDLAASKPEAGTLLQGTAFKAGARYEDFDSKTDKMAEFGLAGLILGGAGLGAAKLVKIGLLAKFWKVILAALIAGKKAIALALAGFAAFFKRIFGRKKAQPPPPATTA
jgi:uncharacterized membrane-anchored protein